MNSDLIIIKNKMALNLIQNLTIKGRVFSKNVSLLNSGFFRQFSSQKNEDKVGVSYVTAESPESEDSKRIVKMYTDPHIKNLLRKLIGENPEKVFRKRKLGQKLRTPRYEFMTEKQLKAAIDYAKIKTEDLLQMPPVLLPRKPIDKKIAFDPLLQGIETSTIILTDITMNIKHKDRLIVARDPCGTLRHASWEERDKMIKTYFPTNYQDFYTPKMFEDPQLFQNVIDRASKDDNTYEFILDRACIQFEPDDPMYISVVEKTYNHIDEKKDYDYLKSTRHYGPMAFYLIRNRKMDNLIIFNLKNERLDDVNYLISLFHLLFPKSKSNIKQENVDEVVRLRNYIEHDSTKKSEMELALNAFLEYQREKEKVEEGIISAHGIS